MKRSILVFGFFLVFLNLSYGQWYVKKYQVSGIDRLNNNQLEESLSNSKKNLRGSGLVAGMGAFLVVGTYYGIWAPDENPTLIQQLMGQKWKNTMAYICGGAMLIGGTTAFIINLNRINKIKYVLYSKKNSTGSLFLAPCLQVNNLNGSLHYGVSLSFHF